jgi:hypothetical protein
MGAGFTAIPNHVLNHYAALGITGAEMLFIIHVWQFWWSEREHPHPSPRTLAERMGVDERTIRNYAASLQAKGYLAIRRQREPGAATLANVYDFAMLLRAVAAMARGGRPSAVTTDPRPHTVAARGKRKNVAARQRKELSVLQGKDPSAEEYEVEDQTLDEDQSNTRVAPVPLELAEERPQLSRSAMSPVWADTALAPAPETQARLAPQPGRATAPSPPGCVDRRLAGDREPHAAGSVTYHDMAGTPGVGTVADTTGGQPACDPAREVLHRYTEVLRAEFNDQASLRSTHSRLVNDFQRARLPLDEFVRRLDAARQLTKERTAAIRKRAETTGAHGLAKKNKAPYFFAVFEASLGLRESPPVPVRRVDEDDAHDARPPSLVARQGHLPPVCPRPARLENAPREPQQVAGQPMRPTAPHGDADEGGQVIKEAVREFSRRFTDWAAAEALGDWAAARWRESGLSRQSFLALAKEAAAAMLHDATARPSAPSYQVRLNDTLVRLAASRTGQTAVPLAPLAGRGGGIV